MFYFQPTFLTPTLFSLNLLVAPAHHKRGNDVVFGTENLIKRDVSRSTSVSRSKCKNIFENMKNENKILIKQRPKSPGENNQKLKPKETGLKTAASQQATTSLPLSRLTHQLLPS